MERGRRRWEPGGMHGMLLLLLLLLLPYNHAHKLAASGSALCVLSTSPKSKTSAVIAQPIGISSKLTGHSKSGGGGACSCCQPQGQMQRTRPPPWRTNAWEGEGGGITHHTPNSTRHSYYTCSSCGRMSSTSGVAKTRTSPLPPAAQRLQFSINRKRCKIVTKCHVPKR